MLFVQVVAIPVALSTNIWVALVTLWLGYHADWCSVSVAIALLGNLPINTKFVAL